MSSKTLITIIGPTGIGKTALSIAFAKAYSTHIISCDSRQFYNEMSIGTAVPSTEELLQAPHHFIQNRSVTQPYTAGSYENEAIETITELFKTHDILILVGGSPMYEKAVTKGLDDIPAVDKKIIADLDVELKENGLNSLLTELKKVDLESYHSIDLNNERRVLRALSIYRSTGIKWSELKQNYDNKRDFNVLKIGLEAPREKLYNRINDRVDLMIENGLLDEARSLKKLSHLPALQTVGYKELFEHWNGAYGHEEAVRLIKRNSRRFAKRQLTWYRNYTDIKWFSYNTCHTTIVQQVQELLIEKRYD